MVFTQKTSSYHFIDTILTKIHPDSKEKGEQCYLPFFFFSIDFHSANFYHLSIYISAVKLFFLHILVAKWYKLLREEVVDEPFIPGLESHTDQYFSVNFYLKFISAPDDKYIILSSNYIHVYLFSLFMQFWNYLYEAYKLLWFRCYKELRDALGLNHRIFFSSIEAIYNF